MELNKLKQDLNDKKVLAIGFYGAGNFGDELLCEVVINLLNNTDKLFISYSERSKFHIWHKPQKNTEITDSYKLTSLMKSFIKSNAIVIGGGGLWSKDSNIKTVIMSCLLFSGRFLLGKKIYLLGVGNYSDANIYGRIGSKISAISSNHIYARDPESYSNFKRSSGKSNVSQIKDLAYLTTDYLGQYGSVPDLEIEENTIIFSIRGRNSKPIKEAILKRVSNNSNEHYMYLSFYDPSGEESSIDQEILEASKEYSNLTYVDFDYNPIDLIKKLQQCSSNVKCLIMPQFHGIITADIAGIKYMPIFYSNKNKLLFNELGVEGIDLNSLTEKDVDEFIQNN